MAGPPRLEDFILKTTASKSAHDNGVKELDTIAKEHPGFHTAVISQLIKDLIGVGPEKPSGTPAAWKIQLLLSCLVRLQKSDTLLSSALTSLNLKIPNPSQLRNFITNFNNLTNLNVGSQVCLGLLFVRSGIDEATVAGMEYLTFLINKLKQSYLWSMSSEAVQQQLKALPTHLATLEKSRSDEVREKAKSFAKQLEAVLVPSSSASIPSTSETTCTAALAAAATTTAEEGPENTVPLTKNEIASVSVVSAASCVPLPSPTTVNETTKAAQDKLKSSPAMPIHALMNHLGPNCTQNTATYNTIYRMVRKVSPTDIGHVVSLLIRREGTQRAWKGQPVGETLRTACFPEERWKEALQVLDTKDFRVDGKRGRIAFGDLWKGYTSSPFRASFVLNWSNDCARASMVLALIYLSINKNCVDFPQTNGHLYEVYQTKQGVYAPWFSLEVIDTIVAGLNSGDPQLREEIEALLSAAAGPIMECPGLVLQGLCKLHNRDRQEAFKRMLQRSLRATVVNQMAFSLHLQPAFKANTQAFINAATELFNEKRSFCTELVKCGYFKGGYVEEFLAKCNNTHFLGCLVADIMMHHSDPRVPGGPEWFAEVLTMKKRLSIPPEDFVLLLKDEMQRLLVEKQLSYYAASRYAEVLLSVPRVSDSLKKFAKEIVDRKAKELDETIQESLKDLADGKTNAQGFLDIALGWCTSKDSRSKELYCNLVDMIFNELPLINEFPDRLIEALAYLLGNLIATTRLPSREHLERALRFVLSTLESPNASAKAQKLAVIALQCFMSRLPDWPEYSMKIRSIPNIERMIPGILNAIDGRRTQQSGVSQTASVMHQLDISTLTQATQNTFDVPSLAIREKIGFILNNLDQKKINSSVGELRDLVTPNYYRFFANYLIVKRVALEPNFHKLYLEMLDKFGSRELMDAISQEAYASSHALLRSSKIRTNSSERSLLKNIGAWIGQTTLAKDIPLLARDLNPRELLIDALSSDTLIAVAPFVAKILEHAVSSKVFQPPNPWVMGILNLMVDIYQLPGLKLTLRFEVEMLCNGLGLQIKDMIAASEGCPTREAQKAKLSILHRNIDPASSPDFHPPQNAHNQMIDGYNQNWEGRLHMHEYQHHMMHQHPQPQLHHPPQQQSQPPPPQPIPKPPHSYDEPFPVQNLVLDASRAQYREPLGKAFHFALTQLIQTSLERVVQISSAATKELVVKDFMTEPDDSKMLEAAQTMVITLASQLAVAFGMETMRMTTKTQLRTFLSQLGTVQDVEQLLDYLVDTNLKVAMNLFCDMASQQACYRTMKELEPSLNIRRQFREEGGWECQRLPIELLDENREFAAKFLASLPDPVLPRPLSHPCKTTYSDFANYCVDKMYHSGATVASIEFLLTEAKGLDDNSPRLAEIRRDLEAHIRQTSNVIPIVKLAGKWLFDPHQTTVVKQLCIGIFSMLKQKDDSASTVVEEVTNFFEALPDKAKLKEPTMSLVSNQLLNVQRLDDFFARTMKQDSQTPLLDLAAAVAQKFILEDKETLLKRNDLHQTLQAFALVLKERSEEATRRGQTQAKQTFRIFSLVKEPESQQKVRNLFNQWMNILDSRSPLATRTEIEDEEMKFVEKLQSEGMLARNLGKFLTLVIEISVEDFTAEFVLHSKKDNEGAKKVPPIPACTLETNPKLFKYIDATSDLVSRLMQCCPTDASGRTLVSSLVQSVLNATTSVLTANHDFYLQPKSDQEKWATSLGGVKAQDEFCQQPYHRLLSNFVHSLALLRHQMDRPIDPADDPVLLFAKALRAMAPTRLPGFAFAWFDLISNRRLLPAVLGTETSWPVYVRHLQISLRFLDQNLRKPGMHEPTKLFHKGLTTLLYVLHEEFPKFLCTNYFSIYPFIPSTCIQLQNMVLSAVVMKLPKYHREISLADLITPDIPSTYTVALEPVEGKPPPCVTLEELNKYLTMRQPSDFPANLPERLKVKADDRYLGYNIPVLSAIVLHTAQMMISEMGITTATEQLKESSAWALFSTLCQTMDHEGRFLLLRQFVMHLRYPNTHTKFFSQVLLNLFLTPLPNQDAVQEQIATVLVERFQGGSPPYPWGVLSTFWELTRKDEKYQFWSKPFLQKHPEVLKFLQQYRGRGSGTTADTPTSASPTPSQ